MRFTFSSCSCCRTQSCACTAKQNGNRWKRWFAYMNSVCACIGIFNDDDTNTNALNRNIDVRVISHLIFSDASSQFFHLHTMTCEFSTLLSAISSFCHVPCSIAMGNGSESIKITVITVWLFTSISHIYWWIQRGHHHCSHKWRRPRNILMVNFWRLSVPISNILFHRPRRSTTINKLFWLETRANARIDNT